HMEKMEELAERIAKALERNRSIRARGKPKKSLNQARNVTWHFHIFIEFLACHFKRTCSLSVRIDGAFDENRACAHFNGDPHAPRIMALCKYCHQPAGWFRRVHKKCRKQYEES